MYVQVCVVKLVCMCRELNCACVGITTQLHLTPSTCSKVCVVKYDTANWLDAFIVGVGVMDFVPSDSEGGDM